MGCRGRIDPRAGRLVPSRVVRKGAGSCDGGDWARLLGEGGLLLSWALLLAMASSSFMGGGSAMVYDVIDE